MDDKESDHDPSPRLPSGLMPIDELIGDDAEDTKILKNMGAEARRYLESMKWCGATKEGYFGGGVGNLLAIFLFLVVPARPGIDDWIWVVIGDIPSAYLPIEDARTPKEVFKICQDGMRRWIAMARGERSDGSDIPPVKVPATGEWADRLEKRLILLEKLLPGFFEDLTVQ